MGSPKAALDWHGSTLLRRVTDVVGRAVDGPVWVVRAPDQTLPALPGDVRVVDDPVEGLGPLQGLAVGLAAAADTGTSVAFACSTDLPFLHTAFVRAVVRAVTDEVDVALPVVHGHRQPMAAAYRTALAPQVEALLAAGERKPALLFDRVRVHRLDEPALLADPAVAAGDPQLDSVANVNEPADYDTAVARPAPEVEVRCFGTLAAGAGTGTRTVRAATLAAAAAAAGVTLDRHVIAALNGDRLTRDGLTALVSGDRVDFLAADAGG
jgi:molybdenum cofactor guanylyltransferase